MTTERHDNGLTEVLKAARVALRPGWRERALGRMTNARPRRRRVWLLALVLLALSGWGAASVLPLFIEGKLYFRSSEELGPNVIGHWDDLSMSGDLEVGEGFRYPDTDLSPVDGRATWSAGDWNWPSSSMDIFVAQSVDSESLTNLTATAGLGGVNCSPRWSPDGSMIAFIHCDPEEDRYPCDVGFHLWVVDPDSTQAHRVTPEDFPPTGPAQWSPDGLWLLTSVWPTETQEGYAIITDIWGADIWTLPNVGASAAWSPDGSMIASSDTVEGELEGVLGVWRQLVLTNADGSDPEVLIEQFIVHSEVAARYPDEDMLAQHPEFDWHSDVVAWVGPRDATWSPDGNTVAFLAALPFDPEGLYYKNQLEIWVYDLRTDELTQVTDDDIAQHGMRWKP